MTDSELIDQIQEIRAKNNVAHVSLLRLAFEVAPERARAIVAEIVANDKAITALDEELANADRG